MPSELSVIGIALGKIRATILGFEFSPRLFPTSVCIYNYSNCGKGLGLRLMLITSECESKLMPYYNNYIIVAVNNTLSLYIH